MAFDNDEYEEAKCRKKNGETWPGCHLRMGRSIQKAIKLLEEYRDEETEISTREKAIQDIIDILGGEK